MAILHEKYCQKYIEGFYPLSEYFWHLNASKKKSSTYFG